MRLPQFRREPPPALGSQGPAPFRCELRHSGRDAAWLTVGGELDLAVAPYLASRLEDALASARLVVIDLRPLTFMDSSGLSVLVAAHQRALRSGRRLVLVRGPEHVTRRLAISGLLSRFEIADLPAIQ